jgi:hypothetical protein
MAMTTKYSICELSTIQDLYKPRSGGGSEVAGLESMHGILVDAGLIGPDKGNELYEVPKILLLNEMESSLMFSPHTSLPSYSLSTV